MIKSINKRISKSIRFRAKDESIRVNLNTRIDGIFGVSIGLLKWIKAKKVLGDVLTFDKIIMKK